MQIATKALRSQAKFSACGVYRYSLERKFFQKKARIINFIMLNPSTADEHFNDPTIAKCEQIACGLGFTDMIVTNLFAYRATDPKDMKRALEQGADIIGPDNDDTIAAAAKRAEMILCAWGNHGTWAMRSQRVRALLKPYGIKMHLLQQNKNGEPKHPLYIALRHKPQLMQA